MGFRDARAQLLASLHAATKGGRPPQHEPRQPPEKNHVALGLRSLADVFEIGRIASGHHYRARGEHRSYPGSGIEVHELRDVRWQGELWYVKWFFDGDQLWFISVHPS